MRGIFHLSFIANNFEVTRTFYEEMLGCPSGREEESWVDIQFFGHQLTIHKHSESFHLQPIDHFGLILKKDEWQELSERLASKGVDYVLPPKIKDPGSEKESGKYILEDPEGNILEFKYYSESTHPMRPENS